MTPKEFVIWLRAFTIGKQSISVGEWLTILKKLNDVDGAAGHEWFPNINPYSPDIGVPRVIGPYIEPNEIKPGDYPLNQPVLC